MRTGRSSRRGSQKGRRGAMIRKKGHEELLGAAKVSQKKEADCREAHRYAVANPSQGAKRSGTPNSLIVIGPANVACALRASRSCHERRACARWAWERSTSAERGCVMASGGRLTSMCWSRTSCMQARRCSLRLQSCVAAVGAEPTASGCRRMLT